MGSLGQVLREGRKRQGLSLEQVEERTKIRGKYLEALESGNYDQLPEEVYTRGFVRNYALLLGLDLEEVLRVYDLEAGAEGGQEEGGQSRPQVVETASLPLERPWLSMDLLVALVILMGILGFGYYLYGRFILGSAGPVGLVTNETGSSSASAVSGPSAAATPSLTITVEGMVPTPTMAGTESPALPPLILSLTPTVPSSRVQVRIKTIERVWLRVRVDGKQVFEGVLDSGFSQVWEGRREVYFRCGNAGGILATVNGREQGPLGGPGEVVDWTWVTGGVTPTPTGVFTSVPITVSQTLTRTSAPTRAPTPTLTIAATAEVTVTVPTTPTE